MCEWRLRGQAAIVVGERHEEIQYVLPAVLFVPFHAPPQGLTVSGLFSLTRSRELCDAFGKYFPPAIIMTVALSALHLTADPHLI